MRNPNDPIPGFEDEYTGTVGHEKAIHRTHFQSTNEKPSHPKDDPNWVQVAPGRWKRVYAVEKSAEVRNARKVKGAI